MQLACGLWLEAIFSSLPPLVDVGRRPVWVGPAPRELTLRGHSLWELQTLGWSLGDAGSPEEVCMGSEDVGLELAPEGVGKKDVLE